MPSDSPAVCELLMAKFAALLAADNLGELCGIHLSHTTIGRWCAMDMEPSL